MANEIARRLRKTMTPQEVKLWVHLRSWRKRGFHFAANRRVQVMSSTLCA
jgi:very-short-patch-repair endonuclease